MNKLYPTALGFTGFKSCTDPHHYFNLYKRLESPEVASLVLLYQ